MRLRDPRAILALTLSSIALVSLTSVAPSSAATTSWSISNDRTQDVANSTSGNDDIVQYGLQGYNSSVRLFISDSSGTSNHTKSTFVWAMRKQGSTTIYRARHVPGQNLILQRLVRNANGSVTTTRIACDVRGAVISSDRRVYAVSVPRSCLPYPNGTVITMGASQSRPLSNGKTAYDSSDNRTSSTSPTITLR